MEISRVRVARSDVHELELILDANLRGILVRKDTFSYGGFEEVQQRRVEVYDCKYINRFGGKVVAEYHTGYLNGDFVIDLKLNLSEGKLERVIGELKGRSPTIYAALKSNTQRSLVQERTEAAF